MQSTTLAPAGGLLTKAGERPALQCVQVTGALAGALLDLTVEQWFINDTQASAEVCYTFPLPWGAVLLALEVRLGERLLDGQVLPGQQASARYESAIDDGNAAVMLQLADDGSCTLNLGNLAPGETCHVKYRFTQVLRITQNSLRLMLPTVIAPRYGGPVGVMAVGQLMQTAQPDALADYPFELALTLDGSLSAGAIASPSHPITVAVADDSVRVTLSRRGHLDRDFVLVVDALPSAGSVLLGPDPVHSGQVVGLASFAMLRSAALAPVTVKFLIDGSGSMAGDSIAAAREAVATCLSLLQPNDRFSLAAFGNDVHQLAPRLMAVRPTTLASAKRWLATVDATMGGTEMQLALTRTFAIDQGSAADVLLVTDGQIEAIRSTVAAAQQSGQRVFAVGIGAAPVEALLRQLVDATGGAFEFVSAGEDAAPAIRRMFERLRAARPLSARCDWDEAPVWSAATAVHPVLPGDTMQFFARFARQPHGEARLSWTDQDGAHHRMIGLPHTLKAGDAIARLAAAEQIKGLAEAEATALAVQYQLLTPHTCWVMVHQRAEDARAEMLPELIHVRPMLPAGWAGSSSTALSTLVPVQQHGLAQYGDLSMPSVWRTTQSVALEQTGPAEVDAADLKILASLDCQAEVTDQHRDSMHAPADSVAPVDSVSTELTEEDLALNRRFQLLRPIHDMLWQRPMQTWPSTVDGLEALAVPPGIRLWLQRQISLGATEELVVDFFLVAVALHILWGDPDGRNVLSQAGMTLHDEGVLEVLFYELFEMPQLLAIAPCILGLGLSDLLRFEKECVLSEAMP